MSTQNVPWNSFQVWYRSKPHLEIWSRKNYQVLQLYFKWSGRTTLLNELLNGTHQKRRNYTSKRVPGDVLGGYGLNLLSHYFANLESQSSKLFFTNFKLWLQYIWRRKTLSSRSKPFKKGPIFLPKTKSL